jgi:ubiquitin-protein ligase
LTDGEDNASVTPCWQVVQYLQQNNIILDSVPVGVQNNTLQAMSIASGGLCFNFTDMEKGVALFEREAVLHLHSREPTANPPPPITSQAALDSLKTGRPLVEDIKSNPAPAVVAQKVLKKEDLDKAEQTSQTTASTSSVGVASTKRIFREYRDIMEAPQEYWTPFISADDTTQWKVIMEGPVGTPYEGGRWIVSIKFPNDYPFKPPVVRFLIPIYHCNINNDGKLCLDILRDCWSPALTVKKVFASISSLLITPNPNDALDSVKANVYSDNKDTYNRLAAEHKQAHATSTLEELKRAYSIED